MSYVIFARKFRPQTFDEVVGQDATIQTLKNAIKSDRIPQSFLFSGSRGVGKTSVARILAKALNAEGGAKVEFDPKSDNAKEIEEGRSMDVLEIDGASNRGIEEIRNLRETVKFKPSSGNYKVYIIDEVHMLTTEAFNALLKTLEEPPEHVKFIFATTEAHKMPVTILSRCQRFQFRRIPVPEILEKLKAIAKKEKIKFDENALFLIAKASEGALRDAESLLDQVTSFSDGKIKEEDVLALLGLASDDIYIDILNAIAAKDGDQIFSIVKKVYEDGGDLTQFANGLFEIFRYLLIFHCVKKTDEFMEVSDDVKKALMTHKDHFSEGQLLLAHAILQNLLTQLRRPVVSQKLLVESSLLKLLYLDGLSSLENIESQPPAKAATYSAPAAPTKAPEKKIIKSEKPEPMAPVEPVVKSEPAEAPISKKKEKPAEESTSDPSDLDLGQAERVWPSVIDFVKNMRMSTGIFLSEAEPVEVDGGVIVLGLPTEFRFHKESLEKEVSKQLVEQAFSEQLRFKVKVRFVLTEEQKTKVEPEEKTEPPIEQASSKKEDLPEIITNALDVFDGAKIIRTE